MFALIRHTVSYALQTSILVLILHYDLANLQATLWALCNDLEIPFQPAMLKYAEFSFCKPRPCAPIFSLSFYFAMFSCSSPLIWKC